MWLKIMIILKVEIEHGRIVPHEPEKLPERASGVLTILSNGIESAAVLPSDSWPENYFHRTAGAFATEAFERSPQLPLETRDEW